MLRKLDKGRVKQESHEFIKGKTWVGERSSTVLEEQFILDFISIKAVVSM